MKLVPVFQVASIALAVDEWSRLLGMKATFIDGDRWAQFDPPSGRIALASAEEAPYGSGAMVKVADLREARTACQAAGLSAGPIEQGKHEKRFTVLAGGIALVFYTPA